MRPTAASRNLWPTLSAAHRCLCKRRPQNTAQNIKDIDNAKEMEKDRQWRRELIGLRKIEENTAYVKSTWFHLDRNCNMQLIYCLKRLCEPCKEHVDNNFTPISAENVKEFMPLREAVTQYMEQTREAIINNDYSKSDSLALTGDEIKVQLSELRHNMKGHAA